MTAPVTNDLMYEFLKKIQADVSAIETIVSDHTRLLVHMREDDLRLDRIEQGVGLRDT